MLQGNRPRSIKEWLYLPWYIAITQYYNAKRSIKNIEQNTRPNLQTSQRTYPTQEKMSIYQAYAMAKANIDINAFERGNGADMSTFKEFAMGNIGEGTFVERMKAQKDSKKDAIYRPLEWYPVSKEMKAGNQLFQGANNVFSASANMPSMLLDADPVGKVLKHTFAIMGPFYTDGFLNRIHNAIEFDGVVGSAGQTVVNLTMGDVEEIRPTIYPNIRKDLLDEDDVRKELLDIKVNRGVARDSFTDEITADLSEDSITKEDLEGLDKYLAQVDTITKIYSKIPAGLLPAMYYGRSALYIEKQFSDIKELDIKAGSPFSLKPLNSKQLGSIIIDPGTWNLLAVELNDPTVKMEVVRPDTEDMMVQQQIIDALANSDDKNIQDYAKKTWLAAKDILYFTMNDNNVIPNSYQRGVSMLTPSVPISEERRRIYEVILPEINQTQWTGTIFWDLVGWTAEEAAELMALAETGRHIPILKAGATPNEVKFTPNIDILYKYLDWAEDQIVRSFGLSSFAMNKEAALNKAASTNSLILINEGIVDTMRNMVKDTMNTYWYPGLIREYFGGQDQYIHIKIKIAINFVTKTFESFFEKAFAISKLINEGLITLNEGRKMLKMSQLTDEEIKLLRKGNISPDDAQEMMKNGQNPFSEQNMKNGGQNDTGNNDGATNVGPANQPGGSSPPTSQPTQPSALNKLPRSS